MNNIWTYILGTATPITTYCEEATRGLIARPIYFISDIPYVLLGIYFLTKKTRISIQFGLVTILLGFAAALYDASFTFSAQVIDYWFMFMLVSFLLGLNLKRLYVMSLQKLRYIFLIMQIAYLALLILVGVPFGVALFSLTAGLVIVTELMIWQRNQDVIKRNWVIALMSFVAGWICWLIDYLHIVCDPANIFNGRVIFHILTIFTIFQLYKHYKRVII